MSNEAIKNDQEKLRTDLLPVYPMEEIARVLTFGAKKYADRNWEKGFKYSRVYGALLRHVFAWWRGENKDPETGMSHLAHAGCCVMFLLEFEKTRAGTDDRPYDHTSPEVYSTTQLADAYRTVNTQKLREYIGMDFAKEGEDKTVLAARDMSKPSFTLNAHDFQLETGHYELNITDGQIEIKKLGIEIKTHPAAERLEQEKRSDEIAKTWIGKV